jgi:protein-S-isoprenylcysteine O-methyltransferase Ste14
MPKHIRFLMGHAIIGSLAGLAFTGILFGMDVANLRHLVLNTAGGWLALVVMGVLFAITFGSVQMGRAIMALERKRDTDVDDGGPRGGQAIPILIPVDPRQPRR